VRLESAGTPVVLAGLRWGGSGGASGHAGDAGASGEGGRPDLGVGDGGNATATGGAATGGANDGDAGAPDQVRELGIAIESPDSYPNLTLAIWVDNILIADAD
jgi:hypothetical protein